MTDVNQICPSYTDLQTRANALGAIVEALRRELPQLDCRRTGGLVSDLSGKHCPLDDPCQRCRLETAEARAEALEAELERLNEINRKYSLRLATTNERESDLQKRVISAESESEEACRAAIQISRAVGLPYVVSWPELVGRVQLAFDGSES